MVPITEEEKQLPYAKYYYQEMAPIPEDKIAIWNGPMAEPYLATPIEERNRFLSAEPMALQSGFTIAPNGTGFVANTTFMPDVTPEMFDWWFGWHSVGSDLRYKIWDRDDHHYARAMNPKYVLDPEVPNHQKTWGVTHNILEDIGFGPEKLLLDFKKPSDLGYDMCKIGRKGCAAIVCAAGRGSAPAIMTHKCIEAEKGIWFISHFWMGYGLDDRGALIKLIPNGKAVPEKLPRALFGHNIKEYTNLAVILPRIYFEEKDKF